MIAEGRDATGIDVTGGWHSQTGRVFKPTSEYLRTNGRVIVRSDVTAEGHSLLEPYHGGYLDKSYYTQDSLGSIIGTFNDKARVDERYNYDAFGRLTEGRFDDVNRLGYNGKRIDPFMGQYCYGFRDFHPLVMRWTTVDPIRDGQNWYIYCGNDSINRIDILGLMGSQEDVEAVEDFIVESSVNYLGINFMANLDDEKLAETHRKIKSINEKLKELNDRLNGVDSDSASDSAPEPASELTPEQIENYRRHDPDCNN